MLIASTLLPNETLQKEIAAAFPDHEFYFKKGIKEVEAILPETEVLITYGEDLDRHWLAKAESLKWVCVMSAGMEKLPFKELDERNILVTNARGIHAIPMAEYAIGMMLSHIKCFPAMRENHREHIWNRRQPFGELHGKTLLILGTGAIGSEIARLSQAFSMKTIGMNRSGNTVQHFDEMIVFDQLNETLSQADVIVSVLPSTPDTKGLLKEEHFRKMKPDSLFINIGRGDLIEGQTLVHVLEEKMVGHIVLDVFPQEPLDQSSTFWEYPNLTVTPHISSISEKYIPRAFDIFEHNFKVYTGQIQDEYVNKINLNRGY